MATVCLVEAGTHTHVSFLRVSSCAQDDFNAWRLWMRDVMDPGTKTTWFTWNKGQLEKVRNERRTATHPHLTAAFGLLECVPTSVLVLGCINELKNTELNSWAPPSRSPCTSAALKDSNRA